MKKNCNLYILHETRSKSKVYAISEHQEFIAYYISLFDEYFGDDIDKSDYNISITSNNHSEYLSKYINYQLQPIGIKNKFVLTEWEWAYYKPYFKKLYERAKETIINLRMFEEIYSYQTPLEVDTLMMRKTADTFYNVSPNFDTFIENIPINFIKRHVLTEPIQAHKFNVELQEIEDNYRIKLYKND